MSVSLAILLATLGAEPDAGAAASWPYVSDLVVNGQHCSSLQQAIDAAPDGTTLRLRQGVYAGPLKVSKKHGLHLVGEGQGALVLVQTIMVNGSGRPSEMVLVNESSDISFENLFFIRDLTGRESKSELLAVDGFQIMDSRGVRLRHVFVKAPDRSALVVARTPGTVIEDSIIVGDGQTGLFLWASPKGEGGATVKNSRVFGAWASLQAGGSDLVACDWIDKRTVFKDFLVEGSLLRSGQLPSICPTMTSGIRGNVVVRARDENGFYPLHLEQQNQVAASMETAPKLSTIPAWYPPEELFGRHLESFADLPPPDDEGPQPGTDWPFCIRRLDWPQFPGGPQQGDPSAYPNGFPGCASFETPGYPGWGHVVERRKGWTRFEATGGGFMRTGKVAVWQSDANLSTPCVLESNGAKVMTHAFSAKAVEALDDAHVAVIGTADPCGAERLNEKVVVPRALQPASKRPWKLVCAFSREQFQCPTEERGDVPAALDVAPRRPDPGPPPPGGMRRPAPPRPAAH